MKSRRDAFTLVELLVVVAIIVVLLAMLVPGMEKAIYEAALVECSTRQRSVTSGLIQYAFDNKRYYPTRGLVSQDPNQTSHKFLNPMQVYNPLRQYDVRPPLKGFLVSINTQLQCPLSVEIEIENTTPGSVVETSYMMYWGWMYKLPGEKGMFRLDESFTYQKSAYDVLLSDMDLVYGTSYAQASHPDRTGKFLEPFVWNDRHDFGAIFTLSRWSNQVGVVERGPLDDNFAFADNSVQRYTGVRGWKSNNYDDRMDRLHLQYNSQGPLNYFYLPAR